MQQSPLKVIKLKTIFSLNSIKVGSKNIDLGLTPSIQNLIEQRKWRDLDEVNKVRNIYNFVRDEVQFGYNTGDTIQASQVLSDGYGQCNTKATLLMA